MYLVIYLLTVFFIFPMYSLFPSLFSLHSFWINWMLLWFISFVACELSLIVLSYCLWYASVTFHCLPQTILYHSCEVQEPYIGMFPLLPWKLLHGSKLGLPKGWSHLFSMPQGLLSFVDRWIAFGISFHIFCPFFVCFRWYCKFGSPLYNILIRDGS